MSTSDPDSAPKLFAGGNRRPSAPAPVLDKLGGIMPRKKKTPMHPIIMLKYLSILLSGFLLTVTLVPAPLAAPPARFRSGTNDRTQAPYSNPTELT
jgi:hypothetical protein